MTHFGKFKYQCVTTGLKKSQDFAQEVMKRVLQDIEDGNIYLYDTGVFSNYYDEHINLLDETSGKTTTKWCRCNSAEMQMSRQIN